MAFGSKASEGFSFKEIMKIDSGIKFPKVVPDLVLNANRQFQFRVMIKIFNLDTIDRTVWIRTNAGEIFFSAFIKNNDSISFCEDDDLVSRMRMNIGGIDRSRFSELFHRELVPLIGLKYFKNLIRTGVIFVF